jgi:hypothetical protein
MIIHSVDIHTGTDTTFFDTILFSAEVTCFAKLILTKADINIPCEHNNVIYTY